MFKKDLFRFRFQHVDSQTLNPPMLRSSAINIHQAVRWTCVAATDICLSGWTSVRTKIGCFHFSTYRIFYWYQFRYISCVCARCSFRNTGVWLLVGGKTKSVNDKYNSETRAGNPQHASTFHLKMGDLASVSSAWSFFLFSGKTAMRWKNVERRQCLEKLKVDKISFAFQVHELFL